MGKIWYIYVTEYDSAIKRNELLILISVENIMLSERNQTQKEQIFYDYRHMISRQADV